MSEREPKTMTNIDYLGRSYDVVTMDPLWLAFPRLELTRFGGLALR